MQISLIQLIESAYSNKIADELMDSFGDKYESTTESLSNELESLRSKQYMDFVRNIVLNPKNTRSISDIIESIRLFIQAKETNPSQFKNFDIQQLSKSSYEEIDKFLNQMNNSDIAKNKKDLMQKLINEEAERFGPFETSHGSIIMFKPLSKRSSIAIGKYCTIAKGKVRWCTTAESEKNSFDEYLNDKNLQLFYLIKTDGDIDKDPNDKISFALRKKDKSFYDEFGIPVDADNMDLSLKEIEQIYGKENFVKILNVARNSM
jgi:hypothetical protein